MRVVVVGVGNDMRGDDGIGVFLARELKRETGDNRGIMIIETQVPENFIMPILDFRPDRIIILDSADFKEKPGSFRMIKKDEILQFLISTHNMPLTIFLKALEKLNAEKILIGIQPKNLDFGEDLSMEVKKRAGDILEFVRTLI